MLSCYTASRRDTYEIRFDSFCQFSGVLYYYNNDFVSDMHCFCLETAQANLYCHSYSMTVDRMLDVNLK